jgi:hypothetical protein
MFVGRRLCLSGVVVVALALLATGCLGAASSLTQAQRLARKVESLRPHDAWSNYAARDVHCAIRPYLHEVLCAGDLVRLHQATSPVEETPPLVYAGFRFRLTPDGELGTPVCAVGSSAIPFSAFCGPVAPAATVRADRGAEFVSYTRNDARHTTVTSCGIGLNIPCPPLGILHILITKMVCAKPSDRASCSARPISRTQPIEIAVARVVPRRPGNFGFPSNDMLLSFSTPGTFRISLPRQKGYRTPRPILIDLRPYVSTTLRMTYLPQ